MTRRRVDLLENGPAVEVDLVAGTGLALAATRFVDARPRPGTRTWSLVPLSKVGALAVGEVEVHVEPKVPVARLVRLLEHSPRGVTWQGHYVDVAPAPDLLTAVAEVYERRLRHALRPGLLQGYRTVEDALPVVRGRIRETDQLRRRFGLPVPVEVRYDDYTVDTAENRLLRAAVTVCRRMPALPGSLATRLAHLDRELDDVARVRPAVLESWLPSRLNLRLQPVLRLAEAIVSGTSFEPGGTGLDVAGFVVNMAKVFEDVVCAGLGVRLIARTGTTRTQEKVPLDVDGAVVMKPDLVWRGDSGGAVGVVDAKYKAEKPGGFPDADLYQMLAYCTALGLGHGHLVYAKGEEVEHRHEVCGSGVVVHTHVLDLGLPPRPFEAALDGIAQAMASTAGI
ncbi:McrBC 5-methylcytosine restriction system component [Kineococcus sp. NUM-3379]